MKKSNNRLNKAMSLIGMVTIIVSLTIALVMQIQDNRSNDTISNHISKEPSDHVVLRYCTWEDERFYMEPIVEAFNATNPRIQIEVTFIEGEAYDDHIVDLLKEAAAYDIIGIRGFTKMMEYQEAGVLTDMTAMIQNSAIDVTNYGNMYNSIAIDNHIYAFPTRNTCWVLVYNKDLFDAYDQPYPDQLTWDDYRRISKEITDMAKDQEVWGGHFVPWNYNFGGILRSNYLYDDDLTYTRESIAFLNDLMNVDHSHMTVDEMASSEYLWLELFEQGKIAMMPQGEWFVGMIMDDIKEGLTTVNWDLAPMPIFEGQKENTTWGQYQFTGIATNCQDPQSAFDFIEYISGSYGATILAQHGMLGAYSDDNIQMIYKNTVGNENTDVFFDALRIQEYPLYGQYESLYLLFNDITEAYLRGETTLDEAMDAFVTRRESLIH